MKRKWILPLVAAFACAFIAASSRGQGTFVNLDFEAATVPPNEGFISAAQALPGWTAYLNGVQYDAVEYNNVSPPSVSLYGPGSGSVLQGSYTAGIATGPNPLQQPTALAQTGQIPQNAQTLIFWSSPGNSLQAAFDGQMMPLILLGSGANYVIEGANISSFAGQTGELRFTGAFISMPPGAGGGGLLDNIQFSPNPLSVPEPATCSLILGGVALFALARWIKAR